MRVNFHPKKVEKKQALLACFSLFIAVIIGLLFIKDICWLIIFLHQ